MLERDIEKRANNYAESLGYYQRKYVTPQRRGAPDRIYGIYGRVFWIEYKATGKKPTKLQLSEHKKMRAKGLRVYVCDNLEDAKRILLMEKQAAENAL